MTTKEKKPKMRAHKESKKTGARGARPVKLTDLQKFLITGKSTHGMRARVRLNTPRAEEILKQERLEKLKKDGGHEGFKKLKKAAR